MSRVSSDNPSEKLPSELPQVMSSDQFANLMDVHRERLICLAVNTFKAYPNEFSGLSPELIKEYLHLHDSPKTLSLENLRAFGYRARRSILDRLAAMYGRNLQDLPRAERKELLSAIKSLNAIEIAQKRKFAESGRVTEEQMKKLEWLERIIDVTDTGIARTEEMGVHRRPYDGARFLSQLDGDLRGAEIARWVEDHYSAILTHHADADQTSR